MPVEKNKKKKNQIRLSEIKQRDDLIPNDDLLEQASEQEPRFIGLMIKNRDIMQEVIDSPVITENTFLFLQNAKLFALAVHFYINSGSLLTGEIISDVVKGTSGETASNLLFQRIEMMKVPVEEFGWLKKNLLERALQQKFYEITASNSTKDGVSGISDILTATSGQSEKISDLIGKLVDLEGDKALDDDYIKISDFSETLAKVMIDLEDRRENPEAHRGWLTGYNGIDESTNGFGPGDYSIFVGYPNGGKTTTMINVLVGLASHGANCCYITVESTEAQITERILSKYSKVPSKQIKKGGTKEDGIHNLAWNKIQAASSKMSSDLSDRITYITVPQKTSVSTVLSLVEKRRRKIKADKSRKGELNVVLVDYLDVIDSVEKYPTRPDLEIGDVSVRLQAYGRNHGIAMITAQSFNNEMIKTIKKMQEKDSDTSDQDLERVVGLEGVGGTQKLSRDADYMWGLVLGQHDTKLCVYCMKSRNSSKLHFALEAQLGCCDLIEKKATFTMSKDDKQEPALPLDFGFISPEDVPEEDPRPVKLDNGDVVANHANNKEDEEFISIRNEIENEK